MNPERIYLEHLETIERIASFVARRRRLNADEASEFTQEVCFRLLVDDYLIIRKFEGRSSFSTYLTTVIARLFHQWRVEQCGKWRPSSEARRLGETAIALERLVTRDGLKVDEAIQVLATPNRAEGTNGELEALYARLPVRTPRPVFVSQENIDERMAVDGDTDGRIQSRDQERIVQKAGIAFGEVIRVMDAEDRLLLQMRFWDGLKVSEIARVMHYEQKKIYKRFEKLLRVLRRGLEGAGLTSADVDSLLAGDHEVRFVLDFVLDANGKTDGPGPSNRTDGKVVRDGREMLQ